MQCCKTCVGVNVWFLNCLLSQKHRTDQKKSKDAKGKTSSKTDAAKKTSKTAAKKNSPTKGQSFRKDSPLTSAPTVMVITPQILSPHPPRKMSKNWTEQMNVGMFAEGFVRNMHIRSSEQQRKITLLIVHKETTSFQSYGNPETQRMW